MFIAVLLIITENNSNIHWKQLKCPSTDEWLNEVWYIHIMEYYSATKGNEVLIHVTTWVNLEDTVREASHERLHIIGCQLCEMSRIGSSIETEDISRLVVVQVWRGEGRVKNGGRGVGEEIGSGC